MVIEETFPPVKMPARLPSGGTPFADQLGLALKLRGWNQAKLADRLGITEGAVSKWRSGEREPPLLMLVHIATALHVSVDWLLGIEGAQAPIDERVIRRAIKVLREVGALGPELAALLPSDD